MKKNPLGRTGLMVSEFCLGTMTFGMQTRTKDAHAQINYALERGVNFIDTAEMYPVNPVSAETIGRTERIIGLWLEKSFRRQDVILATKHSGAGLKYVRDGAPITKETVQGAVEASLRRLKTDYIDLYQLHWPNRGSYHFRQNWDFAPHTQNRAEVMDNMAEVLDALDAEVTRGTIRHFGLSNESAWGMAQWLALAGAGKGPRAVTIQNEYSLMCRLFDTDLAELCHHEEVGLLAYSPLAAGLLTGKYQGGAIPKGSRMSRVPELGGRRTEAAFAAVDDYLDVAFKHDLEPEKMALAWVKQRPFIASVIIGATTLKQLEGLIGAADLSLDEAVLRDLDAVHRVHPMPF
ncbi:aldo/keto reductase [Litorivita pollutaquae]|uniref:Aldo/keto reductase n=1 Tax=Litorivita pollutaquae TaxID=2200892 RepID=A0A2V4NB11_9RHOB|nr:aldo/keto reductase [Litorivita pollutaquae]PYC46810.1 aldo/keto reductase [Litorivita pollutaquae]